MLSELSVSALQTSESREAPAHSSVIPGEVQQSWDEYQNELIHKFYGGEPKAKKPLPIFNAPPDSIIVPGLTGISLCANFFLHQTSDMPYRCTRAHPAIRLQDAATSRRSSHSFRVVGHARRVCAGQPPRTRNVARSFGLGSNTVERHRWRVPNRRKLASYNHRVYTNSSLRRTSRHARP